MLSFARRWLVERLQVNEEFWHFRHGSRFVSGFHELQGHTFDVDILTGTMHQHCYITCHMLCSYRPQPRVIKVLSPYTWSTHSSAVHV